MKGPDRVRRKYPVVAIGRGNERRAGRPLKQVNPERCVGERGARFGKTSAGDAAGSSIKPRRAANGDRRDAPGRGVVRDQVAHGIGGGVCGPNKRSALDNADPPHRAGAGVRSRPSAMAFSQRNYRSGTISPCGVRWSAKHDIGRPRRDRLQQRDNRPVSGSPSRVDRCAKSAIGRVLLGLARRIDQGVIAALDQHLFVRVDAGRDFLRCLADRLPGRVLDCEIVAHRALLRDTGCCGRR